MLLTSLQHRKIAQLLRQKAANLPGDQKGKANDMRGMAYIHLALARAQEGNPELAPAAKVIKNYVRRSRRFKPVIMLSRD